MSPEYQLMTAFWGAFALVWIVLGAIAYLGRRSLLWWLKSQALLFAVGLVVLTYKIFEPVLHGRAVPESATAKVTVPDYDYQPWHGWIVQHGGRNKPFETAAIEAVRQITGRVKFQRQDPVALVLMWSLMQGSAGNTTLVDWETYPFIRCDQRLRAELFKHVEQPTDEQLHGTYVSPLDLRTSPGFERLLQEAEDLLEKDREKAMRDMTPEQRESREVIDRLALFDHICGRITTPLHSKAYLGGGLVDKQRARMFEERIRQHPDPFHIVALDRVPGSGWFSLGEIRAAEGVALELNEAERTEHRERKWQEYMRERLAQTPQRYIKPEIQDELRRFQEQVKAKKGTQALDELAAQMKQRDEQQLEAFAERLKGQATVSSSELVHDPIFRGMPIEQLRDIASWLHAQNPKDSDRVDSAGLLKKVRESYGQNNQKVIDQLRTRVAYAQSRHYLPEDPQFRMLHLDYLEARFPGLYRESAAWQQYPAAQVARLLQSYGALQEAYRSGDAARFAAASQDFFRTTREVSDETLVEALARTAGPEVKAAHEKVQQARQSADAAEIQAANDAFFQAVGQPGAAERYPAAPTAAMEMTFNRVQPFFYAWILMLTATLLFVLCLAFPSNVLYSLGFGFYLTSLALQLYGFYARVMISGRAPVSNMYETVIWVAFMTAVFALILEAKYRKTLFALAGSIVATISLVLADQLPLTLDPKISPLVPVLRSNFWLTIHVLVIVSSYAGGALAWGLGNLSLGLLAIGEPRRDLLKTLSQFTYRAMQIAVLLLAAGTFLGGWWAAYSWGRFWGWDPKENWALISLVCYVIPLHARYIGWVKDFGLAVSAVLCFAAIVMSWYGVNFVLGAGLHSYGFGGGGPWWVFWATLLNIEYVVLAAILYTRKVAQTAPALESVPVEA